MQQKTPIQIAREWYTVDQIYHSISHVNPNQHFGSKIPRDVTSREFAEWLTDQYRMAMAKGIQLGRGEE